jgi:hypothetical protein
LENGFISLAFSREGIIILDYTFVFTPIAIMIGISKQQGDVYVQASGR